MSVVDVDERYRVTLPKEVRETFNVCAGEKLYVIALEDSLIVKRMPQNPAEALQRLLGEFTFDREARRRAEKWLLARVEDKP